MIKISINEEKNEIKIGGHALYDDYGKDIVCAAVSSIVITTINACEKFDKNSISVNEDNPLIIKLLTNNENVLLLIDNMLEMLKELAKDYPKNIKFL